MTPQIQPQPVASLSPIQTLAVATGAVAAFHLAYGVSALSFLIVVFLACLLLLSRQTTGRRAFHPALVMSFAIYGPHLAFFWSIFGPAAIALWAVLALWLGIFVLLAQKCRARFGDMGAAVLFPFLWTGLEYFRSELYYLRFSWLNIGYAFSESPQLPSLMALGMYGIGFVLAAVAALWASLPRKVSLLATVAILSVLGWLSNQPSASKTDPSGPKVSVAGVQMEFPSEVVVLRQLDRLVKECPQAQLLVLSEYTFQEPLPETVAQWCRKNARYLAVGAKDPASGSQFFNTVFVVAPDGQVVFRQAKSVPIQFFQDGLPARTQEVWDSPWGKLGFCICYDLSYQRVTDRLIRKGAEALIVPTMDVADWGRYQHTLHARVAPVRAAELGVPIFRLASSGISQLVDHRGTVLASAPFPGEEAIIAGELHLTRARLPFDAWLAPFSTGLTAFVVVLLGFHELNAVIQRRRHIRSQLENTL